MSTKAIAAGLVFLIVFSVLFLTEPPTEENKEEHELMQTIPAVAGSAMMALAFGRSKSRLGKLVAVIAVIAGVACLIW